MRSWAWGLVSILLPACAWETHLDARIDAARDSSAVDAARCAVVMGYDWNDGTFQGWSASSQVDNVGNALVFRNQGNGSLQAFGPPASNTLAETDSISFSVKIDQYSTVTAPSQLVSSFFALQTPFPGEGSLQFTLDMSALGFDERRIFTFPVSQGMFEGSLGRAAFLGHAKTASLLFAESSFNGNTSAGTLDDFAIVQTVGCEP